MRPKIKHLVVYAFIIAIGFVLAWLFLPKEQASSPETATITKDIPTTEAVLLTEFNDMELDNEFVSSEKAFSGKKSCKLSPQMEYGISTQKFIRDIPSYSGLNKIIVHYKCFMEKDPDAMFVLSVDDPSGKNLLWAGDTIRVPKTGEWSDATAEFTIAKELLNPDNKITLYPWNRNKKEFFTDDIRIEYSGLIAMKVAASGIQSNTNLFFDMENVEGMTGTDAIRPGTAHSGSKAINLSGGKEYGPSVSKKISELGLPPKKISMSMWVFPLTGASNVVLTASVANVKNENIFWDGESTENGRFPKNTWTKLNTSYFLPAEKMNADDILTVNIWNKGKTDVIIDDLEIVYGEEPERRGTPSTVDAKSIYDKTFQQPVNKPPYPTIWLEKQETANDKIIDMSSPGDIYLVGNFVNDKNALDEIIRIGNSKVLFNYDVRKKSLVKIWYDSNSDDSIWRGHERFYTADVNSDKKTDVVLINKDGSWGVITFNGKTWDVITKGTVKDQPPSMIVSTVYLDNKINYGGCFTSDKQQTLEYDTHWRFDLKLTQDNTILGSVDFRGYPADHNPKYYEFLTLVSGHFIDPKRNSIIAIMANCADNDFKGDACKTLENLPYLPNCIQLYKFEE